MVAVLAALPQELKPLRVRLRAEAADLPDSWIKESPKGTVILALTGMGGEAASRAAERILDRHRPSAVISTGFAGSLSECLGPGQLIAAGQVRAPGGLPIIRPDEILLQRALASGELRAVTTVTVPSAASTRESRQALRAAHGAEAVDMESYWIARVARERGIPCLAIRAVLDTVDQEIPHLEIGSTRPGAASLLMLLAFMRSPRGFALLPSLWARSRLAGGRLAVFIASFLERHFQAGREGL
jgi:adenosylhomocysteine nucleosidase